jgi:hypothetical protein
MPETPTASIVESIAASSTVSIAASNKIRMRIDFFIELLCRMK